METLRTRLTRTTSHATHTLRSTRAAPTSRQVIKTTHRRAPRTVGVGHLSATLHGSHGRALERAQRAPRDARWRCRRGAAVRVAAAFGSEWTKQLETASTKLSPAVRDGVLQAVSKLGTAQPPPSYRARPAPPWLCSQRMSWRCRRWVSEQLQRGAPRRSRRKTSQRPPTTAHSSTVRGSPPYADSHLVGTPRLLRVAANALGPSTITRAWMTL